MTSSSTTSPEQTAKAITVVRIELIVAAALTVAGIVLPVLLPYLVGTQLVIHAAAALITRRRSASHAIFDGPLLLLTIVAIVALVVAPFPASTPQALRLLSGIGLFRAALGASRSDLTSPVADAVLAGAAVSSAAAPFAAWFVPGAETLSAPLLFVPISAAAVLAPRNLGASYAIRSAHAAAVLLGIAGAPLLHMPLLAAAAVAAAAAVNVSMVARPLPTVISLLALGHLLLLLAPHTWTNLLFFLQSPAQIETMREAWSRAWLLIRTFPFTGVGPGGFALAVSALYPTSAAPMADQAHNLLLQIASDVGTPGVLIIAAIGARFLTLRSTADAHWLKSGALCMLAVILIDGFTGSTLWLASPLAPFIWLVTGVAARLMHSSTTNPV